MEQFKHGIWLIKHQSEVQEENIVGSHSFFIVCIQGTIKEAHFVIPRTWTEWIKCFIQT